MLPHRSNNIFLLRDKSGDVSNDFLKSVKSNLKIIASAMQLLKQCCHFWYFYQVVLLFWQFGEFCVKSGYYAKDVIGWYSSVWKSIVLINFLRCNIKICGKNVLLLHLIYSVIAKNIFVVKKKSKKRKCLGMLLLCEKSLLTHLLPIWQVIVWLVFFFFSLQSMLLLFAFAKNTCKWLSLFCCCKHVFLIENINNTNA